MPELPDVEVLKRYVDASSLHRPVADVMVREQLVEDTSPQTIRDHLRGAEFTETRRHGKHLFLHIGDDGSLRLHFGMTGTLDAYGEGEAPDHTELLVQFEDGRHLAYIDPRKFGAISWVDDVDAFVEDQGLGPDPLADDVDWEMFIEDVGTHRGSIKGTLMNQDVLAGLGNVYVDEILFQCGIHPESDTHALGEKRLGDVHETMFHVIHEAIDRHADVDQLPDDWLLPHREPGGSCPRDEGTIERIEVVGRSTDLCPHHQKRID